MAIEQTGQEQANWREVVALLLYSWRAEWRATWAALRGAPIASPALQVEAATIELRWHEGQTALVRSFERTAAGAEAVATALADTGLRMPIDVTLVLDNSHVLRTQMRLPRVARSAVRGAVEFELERLSPVPVTELYFDFAMARIGPDASRLEIASRAVRKRVIDGAVSFAHMAGLSVAAIGLGDDARLADWRCFPLDRGGLLRAAWRDWGHLILGGLVGLLLLSILFAAAVRSAAESDALSDTIAAVQSRATVASRLAHQLDALRDQATFVAASRSQPTFTRMLNTLSQVLPDGTWVTNLQLGDDGTIHLQGFSRSAADLPGILDRAPEFSAARFVAPLVRNDADGTERFDLIAQVRIAR